MSLRRALAALALCAMLGFGHGAHAALAVDGNAHGNNALNSISVSLTTTTVNDAIFVIVEFNVTGCGTAQTGSVSDTAALTWHFRTQSRITTGQCIAEYWAASPAVLTGDSITWNSGATSSFNSMTVLGVSGSNTASPFDSNASIPASVIAGTAMAPFSTTAATSLVLASGRLSATSAPTAGSGWTGITSGVSGSFQLVEYQAFTSAQTSITPTATTGANGFNGAITDALVPGVTGSGTGNKMGLLGVGQ